ncbi:MAG TPA: glutathione S-transferase N-terminal domain-containing protein [Polyangiaceae bacterium]|nr:glutathione S-transferase N-terminal domain-containing protein [Polyangiaceae bacterium]
MSTQQLDPAGDSARGNEPASGNELSIVGRSSSHYTRLARIFAAELGISYSFQIVHDILSTNPEDYAGNPALKVPALRTNSGAWFGALNICRELARRSKSGLRVLWPEDLRYPLLANAQELTFQAMTTEVALIMGKVAAESGAQAPANLGKMRSSLANSMAWLDEEAPNLWEALPERDLSVLEVSLFCLVEHLEFREILPTSPYSNLIEFCRVFKARPSAQQTSYRFDR